MTAPLCLKCGGPAEGRFRLVLGKGRMQRLCEPCGQQLSALVQAAGETCQCSLADARFVAWLETGRWTARDGRSLGPEGVHPGRHDPECPCCAVFGEEDA
jgi:hypothetical protein